MTITVDPELIIPDLIERLDKDVRSAAGQLSPTEMRYLVDTYYHLQKLRIQLGNASGAAEKSGEPSLFVSWMHRQYLALEQRLKAVMQVWTETSPAGRWALSQVGIGPVLAAGLLAHIDPHRAATAGAVWRFAGLDPTLSWGKGEQRPHNARLKALCWKIGDSFVKQHNHERCWYGHVYADRKVLEVARNAEGAFADQAAASLSERRITDKELKTTYEAGRLPAGRIELRARRYAVKLFLAHLHQVMREAEGLPVPMPYVIEHLGHTHLLSPPNWPIE